ncbi:phage tail protein, partial [Staphylococcus aureus]|nr:phage tail protein [Staphylococcus aureus]
DMFASNKRVLMNKQCTNEFKSDMSIFNITSEDLNKVIGRTKDKNGTSWVGEKTRAPYVTVIGEYEDGLTGQPVYEDIL